jgi:hypothetical protein
MEPRSMSMWFADAAVANFEGTSTHHSIAPSQRAVSESGNSLGLLLSSAWHPNDDNRVCEGQPRLNECIGLFSSFQ